MSTWFDTIQKSFADVPVDAANDNGISTTEFLEAAESLTTLFGELTAIDYVYASSLTVVNCQMFSVPRHSPPSRVTCLVTSRSVHPPRIAR